jgi:hypothetical protein
MFVALAVGISLGIWARPWFNTTFAMTPDNTNNWTRMITISVGVGSMLALTICGWFIGKLLDKRGDLE